MYIIRVDLDLDLDEIIYVLDRYMEIRSGFPFGKWSTIQKVTSPCSGPEDQMTP